MKARYIFFAVAALIVSACTVNSEPIEELGQTITIEAIQEGSDALTRTAVQDGGTSVYWEPSDEVKVFYDGTGSRFISNNTDLVGVAKFTGTLSTVIGFNEGFSDDNPLWGLYPYRADATSDGASVTTTLPAEQVGRAGTFAKNTHITLGRSTSLAMGFYAVCGGVRFTLTQEGISKVVFEGKNNEELAGTIKLAFEGGVPVVKSVTNGAAAITLTAPNGTFEIGKWYYIEAIPVSLTNGYTLTFHKDNKVAVKVGNSVTIKRGIFGNLENVDSSLEFADGGDTPDQSSFIQFEDPIAKYACVEKFDTNGDNEVSLAEASVVTSLNGLFTNWNTVTKFDEIQYFKSVKSTEGVFAGLSKLKSIIIPSFITSLGSFQNCSSLELVVIPSSITSLPNFCFDGCKSLSNIELHDAINSIPNYCFRDCSSMMSISLPESISIIGQYAFYGCTSLSSITIHEGVSIGNDAFARCIALSNVELPSDLTTIPDRLFEYCKGLTSISLPMTLKSIGERAFYACRFKNNNSSLTLPPSVTTIGNMAFYGVRHLIIPSTVPVSIQGDSFYPIANFANALGSDSFFNNNIPTILYVPENLVELYKVRSNWSNYADNIHALSEYPLPYDFPVAEPVDLGLSVKWASFNLGASKPEEYVSIFRWGEVFPFIDAYYESGGYLTYEWSINSDKSLIKYNTKSTYGVVDNKTTLDLEDDAANVYWGNNWRIPTSVEAQELLNNCSRQWIQADGINGCKLTSLKPGYTDKSIFIPASGSSNVLWYWLSSLNADEPNIGYGLCIYKSGAVYSTGKSNRTSNCPIRPVCE